MSAKRKQPADPGTRFEDSIGRLEEIVGKLEEGGSSLDEVMALYEEGIQLAKRCTEYLSQAELKLKKLSKESGTLELVDDASAD